jgi:hypothetical protein
MSARPSLDHYNGMEVTSVDEYGSEPFEWALIFEGGATLKNTDGRRTSKPNVAGQRLSTVIFSELDTRLVFGFGANQQEVVLTPTQYTLADERYEQATEIRPQVPDGGEAEAVQEELESRWTPETDDSMHGARVVDVPSPSEIAAQQEEDDE